jgi:hypothetical protein
MPQSAPIDHGSHQKGVTQYKEIMERIKYQPSFITQPSSLSQEAIRVLNSIIECKIILPVSVERIDLTFNIKEEE